MDNDNETITKNKAQFYKDKKTFVHIKIIDSPEFYNGIIVDMKLNYLVIEDRKLGQVPLIFTEIHSIKPYEVKQ